MLIFYYAKASCALASHIALEEAGADYTAVRLDFTQKQQHSPEYLRLNPKGRVPTLVTDRGVLTETPAILQFIGQTYPASGLVPLDDPFALGQMNAFNSYLCATVHVAHAHRMRGYRWTDDPAAIEALKKKVPETVGECFSLIENEFFAGPWVLGERFSVSDGYLYTMARWMEADGVDPERFPKVLEHRRRMSERPTVQRALEHYAA